MACFNNWSVYDFYNMGQAVRKDMITGKEAFPYEFKYIKDIVATKVSMFSYKDLNKVIPEMTDSIIETAILFSPLLCFYKDNNLGWVLCRYSYSAQRSIYNTPVTVNLITLNGVTFAENVPYKDIILVRDNRLDICPWIVLEEYISKMKWIEGAMDKVLINSTLPLAIIGNKKQASQLKQVAQKLGNNSPFIVGDDTIMDQVKGFNIDVPVQPQDIYDLRMKYKNECLSSLGIYNVDEKRERVVTQELVNKNDFADYVYQSCKMERERFCKELSEKSGVNIKLIETYDINYDENTELETERMYEQSKAEAKGTKDGDPNANKIMKGEIKDA